MRGASSRRSTADGKLDVKPLLLLLRAPSQEDIERLFEDVFESRKEPRGLPQERHVEVGSRAPSPSLAPLPALSPAPFPAPSPAPSHAHARAPTCPLLPPRRR